MKSIFGTLILGMALLMVGCNTVPPEKHQACEIAGGTYWNKYYEMCAIDGYSTDPWRENFEQEKLACVRAGGVPTRADRWRSYFAACPKDENVQCWYNLPRVTCNSKSVVVY